VRRLFRTVIGTKCIAPDCAQRDQLLKPHVEMCDLCDARTERVTAVNRKAVLMGSLSVVVLTVLAVAGMKTYVTGAIAAKKAQLIAGAAEAVQDQLAGATQCEAEQVVTSVAASMNIASPQLASLKEALQEQIWRLPKCLAPELTAQLQAAVRTRFYGGEERPDDAFVKSFIEQHGVSPSEVEAAVHAHLESLRHASTAITSGKKLAAEGNFAAAHQSFERATQGDPENSFAWANLGAAAMMLDRPEEARGHYATAIRIDPQNWLAHYNLSLLLARNGRNDEAIDHLGIAVRHLRRQEATRPELDSLVKAARNEDALKEVRNDRRFQELFRN
jgi:Flp pilus assembly protein TadD